MIIHGDALERLKLLPDNSVDSIVTDPPYGLSFMGKKWDYDVPSVELWKECMRVLKHGGFLLSFAGTRTYHRMAVNIEDAGFEIRDMISWLYGSGFPKSLNIGKQIDKIEGNERNGFNKNNHPTVKPIKLMEYLIKLVSKEGATILDPFVGSGTTLLACQRLNRNGIGIEREEDYIKIAQARLNKSQEQTKLNSHSTSEAKK